MLDYLLENNELLPIALSAVIIACVLVFKKFDRSKKQLRDFALAKSIMNEIEMEMKNSDYVVDEEYNYVTDFINKMKDSKDNKILDLQITSIDRVLERSIEDSRSYLSCELDIRMKSEDSYVSCIDERKAAMAYSKIISFIDKQVADDKRVCVQLDRTDSAIYAIFSFEADEKINLGELHMSLTVSKLLLGVQHGKVSLTQSDNGIYYIQTMLPAVR